MSLHKTGRLRRFYRSITLYLVTNITVFLAIIFLKLLNRTTVIGAENVPHRPNTLLLSNHQTMIDSFLVGGCSLFPDSVVHPSVIPWNAAAEENFFGNPVLAWFSRNWKCMPIKRGRKDVGAIFKLAEALKDSPMMLFPEGTRSRTGQIGKARGGAGLLILETQPTVIPVCIEGMDKVLPIGTVFPRVFKHVYIQYGKPLDLTCFYGRGKNKEVAHDIMEVVMSSIRDMQKELKERSKKKEVKLRQTIVNDSHFHNSEA